MVPIIKDKLFFSLGYEKYEASDPISLLGFQSGSVT